MSIGRRGRGEGALWGDVLLPSFRGVPTGRAN
ncbi:hypothetical protein chiPu_0033410, partial [Chiloscyllium punctatum]|nr:hypothetical protein [Chiloscyllium punctatum]